MIKEHPTKLEMYLSPSYQDKNNFQLLASVYNHFKVAWNEHKFYMNICVARYDFVSLPILHEDKHAVFILLCLHHKNCFQIWLIIVLPDTIKTLFFLEHKWTINEWIWNLYIIFYFILPYANISWTITSKKMQYENL